MLPARGPAVCAVACVPAAVRRPGLEHLGRGLADLGLGVDQELRRGDHALAGAQALEHLDPAVGGEPQPHLAGHELAPAPGDEDLLAHAGAHDGLLRDGERALAPPGEDVHRCVHVGLQGEARVVELQPHADGARPALGVGIDVGDAPPEDLARQRLQAQLGLVADAHPGQVLLEDVGVDPHAREVGDLEQHLAGADVLALADADARDDPARGRAQRHGAPHLPRALDAPDLALGHVEQAQPLAGARHQPLGGLPDLGVGAAAEDVAVLEGEEILLGAGDDAGRVDLEEHLPALDRLPGLVDVQPLHPALDLRAEAGDAALVVVHTADGDDAPRQGAVLGARGAHPDVLHHHRIDLDRARGLVPALALVGVDRDVVHAHLVLRGHRRGDARVHRMPVEQDLALLLLGLGLVGVDRDVVHPHLVLGRHRRGDARVHRVAVEEDLAPFLRRPGGRGGGRLVLAQGVPVAAARAGGEGGDGDDEGLGVHRWISLPVAAARRASAWCAALCISHHRSSWL